MASELRAIGVVLLLALATAATAAGGSDGGKETTPALPQATRVQLNLAQTHLAKGDPASALLRAERALRISPKAPEVHAVLAIAQDRLGDQEKAAQSFARAIKFGPANAPVFNAYAAWLCEHGRFEAAEVAFATALADAEFRASGQPLYNAGRCALKAGKPLQADAHLREIIHRDPVNPAALLALAEANLAAGNLLDARAFMQRRDALGSDPTVLRLAVRIEQAAGDPRSAAVYEKRLREEFPGQPPAGDGRAGQP